MSMSGSRLRTSTMIQASVNPVPTKIRKRVLADPQPHVVVSLIARRSAERPALDQHSRKPVDATGQADRRFWDQSPSRHRGDQDRDERNPEEPVVAEVLDDHAREHDPHPAADAEDRREQADPAGHLVSWKLIPDYPEREWEDPARRTLDEAGDDDRDQRARHGANHRADGEDEEGPKEQALLAVHVAEASDDRGADGGCEQVTGEQPRDPGLRRVKLALHRRQRRHDQRAQHRVRQPADREHRQRDVRMGTV